MTAQVLTGVADNWDMSTNLKYAAECPLCHNTKETVWFRIDGETVCRDHHGHPLFEEQ